MLEGVEEGEWPWRDGRWGGEHRGSGKAKGGGGGECGGGEG